jgi:hypothetical protein
MARFRLVRACLRRGGWPVIWAAPATSSSSLTRNICQVTVSGYTAWLRCRSQDLLDAFVEAKWLCDRGSSLILQRLICDLMVTGEFDRYLVRMGRRYRARRDVLIQALSRRLGTHVDITGHAMGLHVVAWLPHLPVGEVDTLVARCAEQGVGVYSVARHAIRRLRRAGLMMGYGLTDERSIEQGVEILADAYQGLIRARGGAALTRRMQPNTHDPGSMAPSVPGS